jgi:hypothetical protein
MGTPPLTNWVTDQLELDGRTKVSVVVLTVFYEFDKQQNLLPYLLLFRLVFI